MDGAIVKRAIVTLLVLIVMSTQVKAETIGIYRDNIPHRASAADPAVLGDALKRAGYTVKYLNSVELADPAALNAHLIDLAVLPYGSSFPMGAAANFKSYLQSGGRFLSMGGYPFDKLYARTDGSWQLYNPSQPMPGQPDLVRDPDYESAAVGHNSTWAASGPQTCDVVSGAAPDGRAALRIRISPGAASSNATWQEELTDLVPGATYLVTATLRSHDVRSSPDGFAFFAVYQYLSNHQLGPWQDVVHLFGNTNWQTVHGTFVVGIGVHSVYLQFGLYNATGEAEMGRVSLYRMPTQVRMNTHFGTPGDGLSVQPDQIGICDPSFRFRRVAYLAPAPDQPHFNSLGKIKRHFEGWPVTATLGQDNATWEPLLNAYDRYGRLRGAAAAIVRNYNGFYKGSTWCAFGVNSADLFAPGSELLKDLPPLVNDIINGPCLHDLQTNFTTYHPGESASLKVTATNFSPKTLSGKVELVLSSLNRKTPLHRFIQSVTLAPGRSEVVSVQFTVQKSWGDFVRLKAEFIRGGKTIQNMAGGFVIINQKAIRQGFPVRWLNNYICRGDRPQFLLGTDTYSNLFGAACESPLTWLHDTRSTVDNYITVFENLQGGYSSSGAPTENLWRSYEGLAQLIQQAGVIYFPCLLTGQNVAISDVELAKQADFARDYALHFKSYPGVIYYLDGDFQVNYDQNDTTMVGLFNRYLQQRYGTEAAFRNAWGNYAKGAVWGRVLIPPMSDQWSDPRAADVMRFQTWLVRRWVDALSAAIRSVDPNHPITSEYYQAPYSGVDVVTGIGTQNIANIGYFDRPHVDLDLFPQVFRSVDLRARGKGISVGEFGVKTHPAWKGSDYGYHTARTPKQARTLFMSLPFYAFALGGCKVQNWDWKDAADNIFPWGINHSNALVPKTWLYTYRNDGLLLGHFKPIYRPGAVWYILPDGNRLGGGWGTVRQALLNGIRYLMDAHIPFNVLDSEHLDQLPSIAKVLFWPIPFCPSDRTVSRIERFVQNGGKVYISGDISFNSARKPDRYGRLEKLIGVKASGRRYPDIILPDRSIQISPSPGTGLPQYNGYPCLYLHHVSAKVLETDASGQPVAVLHHFGKGEVFFTDDPIELHSDPLHSPTGSLLYLAVAKMFGITPESVVPDDDRALVFQTPCEDDVMVDTAFNTTESPLPVKLAGLDTTLNARRPGLVAYNRQYKPIAVSGMGHIVVHGTELARCPQQIALLAEDGRTLLDSRSLLLLPQGQGTAQIYWGKRPTPVVEVGEWSDRKWTVYEKLHPTVTKGWLSLRIGPNRATCVIRILAPKGVSSK